MPLTPTRIVDPLTKNLNNQEAYPLIQCHLLGSLDCSMLASRFATKIGNLLDLFKMLNKTAYKIDKHQNLILLSLKHLVTWPKLLW